MARQHCDVMQLFSVNSCRARGCYDANVEVAVHFASHVVITLRNEANAVVARRIARVIRVVLIRVHHAVDVVDVRRLVSPPTEAVFEASRVEAMLLQVESFAETGTFDARLTLPSKKSAQVPQCKKYSCLLKL